MATGSIFQSSQFGPPGGMRPPVFGGGTPPATATQSPPTGSGFLGGGLLGSLDSVHLGESHNPSFSDLRTQAVNRINSPIPRPDIQLGPRVEVAVVDGFRPQMFGQQDTHGFGVADVVRQQTGLNQDQIALISDSPMMGAPNPGLGLLTAPGPESASQRLTSMIEVNAASGLSNTNTTLEAIANQDAPNLKGVNYSTGMSTLTGFSSLRNMALSYPESGPPSITPYGKVIFDGLGLPQDTTPETMRAFAEKGMARIEQVHSDSPLVQAQLERHDAVSERLAERGVHYTVSAGNDGGVIDMYRGAGVKLPDTADDNLYSNDHNVTVGSLDTRGTADPGDDVMAAHTSGDPQIDFLAPGVDTKVKIFSKEETVSGTSYASPHLMSNLVNLSRDNPGLSTSAVQNLLRNSAGSVPNSSYSAVR